MKKILIAITTLIFFACGKYGSELNSGKDGCIDCVLRFDSIRSNDTTYYELTYPIWHLETNRTDWCNYLIEEKNKTQTIDTIVVKQSAYCK